MVGAGSAALAWWVQGQLPLHGGAGSAALAWWVQGQLPLHGGCRVSCPCMVVQGQLPLHGEHALQLSQGIKVSNAGQGRPCAF
jgi:hypothetical protein